MKPITKEDYVDGCEDCLESGCDADEVAPWETEYEGRQLCYDHANARKEGHDPD